MQYTIQGFGEALPLRFFEEISAIPRTSGNEGHIADYLIDFATQNGFFAYRDAANNVLIKKQATRGREQEPPLLLQAHTDMVAEKNKGTMHDFATDPIHLVQNGNLLSAEGTTLGADDGFGIALILSVLCEAASHPALECLFTAGEEVGMDGAMAFDYGLLSARRMVNLDSDNEQEIITGCCGGLTTVITLQPRCVPATGQAVRLRVSGLCGGHSGSDIHRGRGNALSLMSTWIAELEREMPLALATLTGGDKSNAIPRECEAVVVVQDAARVKACLKRSAQALLAARRAAEDTSLSFVAEDAVAATAFAANETKGILRLLSMRTGVLALRADGTPQLSRNVAAVRTEGETVLLTLSVRSADQREIDFLRLESDVLAQELGATAVHSGAYPGWESDADSTLVRAWRNAAAACGISAEPTVIHAGLECGLFSEKLPGLCAISVGCNIHDLHTPAERMELDSFLRSYRILTDFLKNI